MKSFELERDDKIKLGRIILSAVLLAAVFIIDLKVEAALPLWGKLCMYLVPYLIAGYDVIAESAENIAHGEIFDEDFLMCIATIGALCVGFLPGAEPEFAEAVFVMLFFQIGELFEEIAEGKSRASITALMDIRPDSASVERGGELITVSPEEVEVGEIIVVKPGEKIPLDGTIIDGSSSVDTVALTGESVPAFVNQGDVIISGCVNLTGVIRAKVTKPFGESTTAKILNLVENASENKSKSENFIKKFARYYTPIVVFSALALAIIPPVISGDFVGNIAVWLTRALTFLVISCPCALVVSVPLAFFGGIGCASSHGILIKGSNYVDTLANAGIVVFDKTGTLTRGSFEVTAVHASTCPACDQNELLHLAAHVERYSTHPIAVSLRQAYGNENDSCDVQNVQEIAGEGIRATVNGQVVCVGNERMMKAIGADYKDCHHAGTVIHVAIDGAYAGHVVISDMIKDDSVEAIKELQASGIEKTVMLTGDRETIGKAVAEFLGISEYHAELLPDEKVSHIERLLGQKKPNETLAFVGDGINDAPVLARADVGIAMGALGSDAAIEAADVVLMDDKPSKIALAIRIAKRTLMIAKENIFMALAIKFIVLIMTALGYTPMWLAVFADVGVLILAVCNSMRALKCK